MNCLVFWVSKKPETLRHNALKREIFASLGILDSEGEEEATSKVSCFHRPVRLPGLRLWGREKGRKTRKPEGVSDAWGLKTCVFNSTGCPSLKFAQLPMVRMGSMVLAGQ